MDGGPACELLYSRLYIHSTVDRIVCNNHLQILTLCLLILSSVFLSMCGSVYVRRVCSRVMVYCMVDDSIILLLFSEDY